ncbi:MAG: SGNH/GDSL hydrolase family protein [Planctomycetales bacterium]
MARNAPIPADSLAGQRLRGGDPTARLAEGVSDASAGLAAVSHLLRGVHPATWVFTGDSITHGALFTEGWRSYPEHFSERVRWELRRFHDVVINTAICGERSGGLLANLEQRVLRFRPDVVMVMVGMNDAVAGPSGRDDFRGNLVELVGRLREAGAIPVLQTPNLIYIPNCGNRGDVPAYVEIIRVVAELVEVPLIDHWRHWETRKPEPDAVLGWLQDQSIHPNYMGHREMARLVCEALGIFDPASLTCSLPVENRV